MELRVVSVSANISENKANKASGVNKTSKEKYYSIISEHDGPLIAIFSGRIRMQDILFGNLQTERLKVTKDLLEQIKSGAIISESILFPHDDRFFLQKNKDGTLSDLRDGHVLDL